MHSEGEKVLMGLMTVALTLTVISCLKYFDLHLGASIFYLKPVWCLATSNLNSVVDSILLNYFEALVFQVRF